VGEPGYLLEESLSRLKIKMFLRVVRFPAGLSVPFSFDDRSIKRAGNRLGTHNSLLFQEAGESQLQDSRERTARIFGWQTIPFRHSKAYLHVI